MQINNKTTVQRFLVKRKKENVISVMNKLGQPHIFSYLKLLMSHIRVSHQADVIPLWLSILKVYHVWYSDVQFDVFLTVEVKVNQMVR